VRASATTHAVLVTGFEPFSVYPVNSSGETARAVAALLPDVVRAEVLPVDHAAAHRRMRELLDETRPAACLAMGLAPTQAFRIETVARGPAGFDVPAGRGRLEGAWPWEEMAATLRASGRPVTFSEDAGAYVCETVYWTLLEYRLAHGRPAHAAFLHLPPISDDFPLALLSQAVRHIVEGLVRAARHAGAERGER
jgi:pyroglutamyl-peptidase